MGLMDGLSNPWFTTGMGLLAAAQPHARGQNRFNTLLSHLQAAEQSRMQAELFKMRKEEYDAQKEERMEKATARDRLFGTLNADEAVAMDPGLPVTSAPYREGPGGRPLTDQRKAQELGQGNELQGSITWGTEKNPNTYRQRQTPLSEKLRLMAEAGYGGKAMEAMFPKPSDGTREYKNAIALGLKPGTPEFNQYIRSVTEKKPDYGHLRAVGNGVYNFRERRWEIPPNTQGRDPEKIYGQEQGLRGEFTKATNVYVNVRDAHQRVLASSEDPSAAGDLALVFNYMKVLDPGSTVREGEFANAASAAAWLQREERTGSVVPRPVAQAIRTLESGKILSDDQRNDFVDRSDRLYAKQFESYKKTESRYRDLAAQYEGVNPDRVVYDLSGGLIPAGSQTKTINGRKFVNINGTWYEL